MTQPSSFTQTHKPLLATLRKEPASRIPFWLMRQAGRYLPEYRNLRESSAGFWDLVYDPEKAARITLQPVARYGMDGAIVFSDILVIPHALGQNVVFTEKGGPALDPVRNTADLSKLSWSGFDTHLQPVFETLRRVRQDLDRDYTQTALIGFAGSPWTLACYMVEGGASRDFATIKHWALSDPEGFGVLIDMLTQATTTYLLEQSHNGAEILQLFESWAGNVDQTLFHRWIIAPLQKIVKDIKKQRPDVPVIVFPRGAGRFYLDIVRHVPVDGLGIDFQVPVRWAAEVLQPHVTVQGNLDPMRLRVGGDQMLLEAERILSDLGKGSFVFNLGHGVVKETPPDHVAELLAFVREWRS